MPNTTATPDTEPNRLGWLRLAGLIAGPAGALAVYLALGLAMSSEQSIGEPAMRAAGVLVWMAIWWLTEAIPLPATSLLPLVLLPMLGITSASDAASPYASRVIFLFLGGFMLAIAMERWNFHRRIALVTITLVGSSPAMIVAGFMLATAILSMWMSNTATTIMLVPIGATVIALVGERLDDPAGAARFGICLMLAIAYSASIGGIATPIGTPPNTLLVGFLQREFGVRVSFLEWMLFALPIVVVFLPITWLLLTRLLYPVPRRSVPGGRSLIRAELAKLGATSRGEWTVMAIFITAVVLWFTRGILSSIPSENVPGPMQGLVTLLTHRIDDTSIAIGAALLLFIVPVNLSQGRFVLEWGDTKRLPWGILLLFGGGLSLAGAISSSGLSQAIGGALDGLAGVPTLLIILAVVTTVVYLTEVTSNTATATIFFPLFAPIAVESLGMNPLGLLVPAALAASCAFMMPVATPPNAIVFSSGNVQMKHMVKAGFWLNIVSVITLTLGAYTVITWVFGIDLNVVPDWAIIDPSPAPEP